MLHYSEGRDAFFPYPVFVNHFATKFINNTYYFWVELRDDSFFTDPAVFHTIFKKLERFLFGIFLQEKNVQAKLLQQQSIFPILKSLSLLVAILIYLPNRFVNNESGRTNTGKHLWKRYIGVF